MHTPNRFYRRLATLYMATLYYGHFTYHHLYRHHRDVATPLDVSTARKGQNVYEFIYKSIINSWRAVYNEEKELKKSFFANYAVLSLLGSILFAAGIYLGLGLQAMIMHSLVAFGAIFYL